MNRRSFLQAGIASSLFAGTGGIASRVWAGTPVASRNGGQAKNVIFLVSDGMSMGTLTIADQYLRWRDQKPSNWVHFLEEEIGKRGVMDMSARNSIVTDSAAAAAAWGCGHRVNNGSLNIAPDGTHHKTICVKAKEAGKATGLVTTTQITHATPAGFVANVPRRNLQETIARQMFEREVDVLLGGGIEHFDPQHRSDDRNLIAEFEQKGYAIARTTAQLKEHAAKADKILGPFHRGHLPYEVDRLNNEQHKQNIPSLAQMTQSALQMLSRHENGFLLQVEGGRVDHAAHANDVAGLVFDQIAFDEAIGVAYEFVRQNPDTLVIVTTDHGNANPGLSSGDNDGQNQFSQLSRFTGTHEAILPGLNRNSSVEDIQNRIKQFTQLDIRDTHANMLRDHMRGQFAMPYHRMNSTTAILGQILANAIEIGWMSNWHTSDLVELWAYGPGSEAIRYHQLNTDLHHLMTGVLDLEPVAA